MLEISIISFSCWPGFPLSGLGAFFASTFPVPVLEDDVDSITHASSFCWPGFFFSGLGAFFFSSTFLCELLNFECWDLGGVVSSCLRSPPLPASLRRSEARLVGVLESGGLVSAAATPKFGLGVVFAAVALLCPGFPTSFSFLGAPTARFLAAAPAPVLPPVDALFETFFFCFPLPLLALAVAFAFASASLAGSSFLAILCIAKTEMSKSYLSVEAHSNKFTEQTYSNFHPKGILQMCCLFREFLFDPNFRF